MVSIDVNGLVIQGASQSIRNARIIDRARLRGYNMASQESAFAVFHGGADNYNSGGNTTDYSYGGSSTEVDVSGVIKVSYDQWENGKMNLRASGTITNIPADEIKNYVL